MRSRTRRNFLGAAAGSVATSLLAPAWPVTVRAQPAPGATAASAVRTEELGANLHLVTTGPTNSVARTGQDGLILVDGTTTSAADLLLGALQSLPAGGPVATLFNTHWHPEHTGLNERLGEAGTRIIAQQNTQLWLSTDITYPWDGSHFEPLAPAGRPNDTFFESGELGPDVLYGYLRHAAHTDGDLYVRFADANVLAVGDAVCGDGWPLVDWWTGGWIGGIVGTLELVLALADADTRIIPARGGILSRAEIEEQYEMYNVIFIRLAELLNSGRGPDEAVEALPTAEFDDRMGGASEQFVRRAFESLWAYLSPDA
jgi:glyoxylase-like metal-dependent hydrolase (beta-lactamase superfamily II)